MYNNLVDLHFAYTALINPDYFSHETFKNNIKSLTIYYNLNMNFFHRNKILLTDEIIKQISVMNSRILLVREIYESEYNSMVDFEDRVGTNDPQILYSEPENEVSEIKARINRINSIENIKKFEIDIKELRKKIEEYFKKLIV